MQAECQAASSLRQAGRANEAEKILRSLLINLRPGLLRGQILQTLANTLKVRLQDGESSLVSEIRSAYDEAFTMPNLDQEDMGLLELNAAELDTFLRDWSTALARLERARIHFRRCNSPHLQACEQSIAQIEVAMRDTV